MSASVIDSSPAAIASLLHVLDRGDHWLQHAFTDVFADVPILDRLVWHTNPTSRGLLLAAFGLLLLGILPPLCERLLRRAGCVEPNFRGDRIPQSFGVILLAWTGAMLVLDAWLLPAGGSERRLWLASVVGFGILGLVDDLLGDKRVKGFRAHFRALLRDHRLTTGLVKAAGGLLVALWLGYSLHPQQPLLMLLSALLIVLSANTVNLLDLRPGRASAMFCLTAACLLVTAWTLQGALAVPSLLYVFIPAIIVWERDARAAVMMGDTGSNLLGAALGLGFSVYTGVIVQLIVCVLLVVVQLLAERISLTALIEQNPVLRHLDGLTGLRNPAETVPGSGHPLLRDSFTGKKH